MCSSDLVRPDLDLSVDVEIGGSDACFRDVGGQALHLSDTSVGHRRLSRIYRDGDVSVVVFAGESGA